MREGSGEFFISPSNRANLAEVQADQVADAINRRGPIPSIVRTPTGLARKTATSAKPSAPPELHLRNTELGGLFVGNFDFHFSNCAILVWVWLKFKFSSDITAAEEGSFKTRFLKAVNGVWENTGWHLRGNSDCPCPVIPIRIHAEENAGGVYHKLVDVEKKSDVERRPKVISDINVNLFSSDVTLAHEFGHVLGLYDEYVGPWYENIMFWHQNQPGDTRALMSEGTEMRPRYFEQYRRTVQKGAQKRCDYSISSPLPPAGPAGSFPVPKGGTAVA
jgi:hypothetical protein